MQITCEIAAKKNAGTRRSVKVRAKTWIAILPPFNGHCRLWRQK